MIEERIKQIMETYGLTAGGFADILGIQASGISHILSGRNKPSLDFVTKVLIKFPDIDYNWLVLGRGSMKQMNKPINKEFSLFEEEEIVEAEKPIFKADDDWQQQPLVKKEEEITELQQSTVETQQPIIEAKEPENKPKTREERAIRRIIVFYDDSTYEEVSNK